MEFLIEKIKENANKRLALIGGQDIRKDLSKFRNFLKVETHRLKILHRAGASGLEICKARAYVVDEMLTKLVLAVARNLYGNNFNPDELPYALVAIGGYGRAELNPHSDADIMLLHPFSSATNQQLAPWIELVSRGILFDIGLKVMHTVRSISDAVQIANSDIRSKTSLMESRLIIGNRDLFEKFQNELINRCIKGKEDEYIEARIIDQNLRRQKYGNSATMQEPNIKNGCGGLRDYQNLHWMVYAKYRVRTMDDMVSQGLISHSEKKDLSGAYDFLLRVRTELHYQVPRQIDVLLKRLQPSVAYRLGYKDPSPSRRIEEFMSEYYKHSRNIYLITKTVEERLSLLPRQTIFSVKKLFKFSSQKSQTVDGFKIEDGIIIHTSHKIFDEYPHRLMKLFLYAQQRRLRIHPELVQLIRRKIRLVQRGFQTDPRVGETFIQILNQRGNVAPYIRIMHEVGLLGKYIPEFGKLTNLVQHEFYHQYTLDEHTIVCIEKIDEVWERKSGIDPFYTELLKELEKPYLLYLAILLHDIGKAAGAPRGKHTIVGADIAYKIGKRIGIDDQDAETLQLLVENHLLLAEYSQRRNIDDLSEILTCAKKIKNEENLKKLTIITVADTLGTSESLWNGFKDQLLQTLFMRASNLFDKNLNIAEIENTEREKLIKSLLKILPKKQDEAAVRIHLENLPQRYIFAQNIQQIAIDLDLVYKFLCNQILPEEKALAPVIAWHNQPNKGFAEVKICTWDRNGLFSKIAGSLSAVGLNILSAHIFTRKDGIAIDTFYVTDSETGKTPKAERKQEFKDLLTAALYGKSTDFENYIKKHSAINAIYQAIEGEKIPTKITFLNDISDTLTVIEIETEDKIGLLYKISKCLTELNINISIAKICTEKGAAIDSFYVNKIGGGKIVSEEEQKMIINKILSTIEDLSENNQTKPRY
ncbi:MAG: [protein-PII] uridylyltransferase [Verrucomicrobiia bacterium]